MADRGPGPIMTGVEARIQRLRAADARLLDEVTRMCMATVLETIPEFGGEARRAREALPNFTFEQMRAMLEKGSADEAQRILAAVDEQGRACGYSAFLLKRDEKGTRYGYLFSRGVEPGRRRQGIATRLLMEAEAWFRAEGASYVRAETHVGNSALRTLLQKHGFRAEGPFEGAWPYYVLRKEL